MSFSACAMPDYRSEEVGARHGGRTLAAGVLREVRAGRVGREAASVAADVRADDNRRADEQHVGPGGSAGCRRLSIA